MPEPAIDPALEMAERHAAMLRRAQEILMRVAERLGETAEAPDADLGRITIDLDRTVRGLRRTIALEARLVEQRPEPPKPPPPPRPTAWDLLGLTEPQYLARVHANQRRDDTESLIERAIEQEPSELNRRLLTGDLYENLKDTDDAVFAGDQPLAEIIDTLCASLGISPDWARFEDDDWASTDPIAIAALLRSQRNRAIAAVAEMADPP